LKVTGSVIINHLNSMSDKIVVPAEVHGWKKKISERIRIPN
jgi:hypothetical protein